MIVGNLHWISWRRHCVQSAQRSASKKGRTNCSLLSALVSSALLLLDYVRLRASKELRHIRRLLDRRRTKHIGKSHNGTKTINFEDDYTSSSPQGAPALTDGGASGDELWNDNETSRERNNRFGHSDYGSAFDAVQPRCSSSYEQHEMGPTRAPAPAPMPRGASAEPCRKKERNPLQNSALQDLYHAPLSNPTSTNRNFWSGLSGMSHYSEGGGGSTGRLHGSLSLAEEYEQLKADYQASIEKLNQTMNSIKTFWSPELKRERQMRREAERLLQTSAAIPPIAQDVGEFPVNQIAFITS
uniref:PH domain-containing protein n=1 Tax=Angiostrongylus cantonensis TaxID=6313 RepID=A0A158PAF0_ANGCA